MSETDQLLAAAEAELAALQSQALQQPEPSYGLKQGLYDVGVGTAKSFAGLLDLASFPFVYGANKLGLPTEYGPFTSELKKEIAASTPALQTLGIRPETDVQEYVQYVTPMGVGNVATKGAALKALLKEAALGTTAYAGGQAGKENIGGPYGELIGALGAPAAILGGKAGIKAAGARIAPTLEDVGMGLQRKATGVRQSDYQLNRNAIIEGATDTQLKKSLNNVIRNKTLGTSIDPEKMLPNLIAERTSLNAQIDDVLKNVDQSNVKIEMPSFDRANEYLKSSRVNLTELDNYKNIIDEFKAAVKNESKFVEPELPTIYDSSGKIIPREELPGMQQAVEAWRKQNAGRSKLSLDVLNKQKKVFSEKYKNSPQSDPGFWRAFYMDLKEHIEKYAPEVKKLNKKKQDLEVIAPIIERQFKGAGAAFDVEKAQRLLNTTGGAGLAGGALLGAATTGDIRPGLVAALGLRTLATRGGQNLLGRKLTSAGQSLATPVSLADLGSPVFPRAGAVALSDTINADIIPESLVSQPAGDTDARLLEAEQELQRLLDLSNQSAANIPTGAKYAPTELVKAVMQVESGGNQAAVSPKGARGMMQLMPPTAKELGVNPNNPKENIEGGSRYLQQNISRFGDTKLGLAAYNMGPGALAKALDKSGADSWEELLAADKRGKIDLPEETKNYVKKVMNLMER